VENSKITWNTSQDDKCMIKLFYNYYKARVEHGDRRKVHRPDKYRGGEQQGSVMSSTLFLIIDWIMKKVTDNRTGIAWKLQSKLEDIKFVDDMCYL
jgi:hypothetical protein